MFALARDGKPLRPVPLTPPPTRHGLARRSPPGRPSDPAAAPGIHAFDFGRVAVHPRSAADALRDDLVGTAPPDLDAPADAAQPLTGAPKLAEIKLITGTEGAFSGFPTVGQIDLNKPGPFNDTKTSGTCVNVHQMQFRLSEGDPAEVKLIRKVIRVAVAKGEEHHKGEKDKPADDGPSAPTVIRPKDTSSVVVADAPGFIGKGDASKSTDIFPVRYDADFQLYATDPIAQKILAKMTYTVRVNKQRFDDAEPTNEIKEKSRKIY